MILKTTSTALSIVLVLLTALNTSAQTLDSRTLAANYQRDAQKLMEQYFEPLPSGVTSACDDHVPLGRCKAHKKQCARQCNCVSNYTAAASALEARFKEQSRAVNTQSPVGNRQGGAVEYSSSGNAVSRPVLTSPNAQIGLNADQQAAAAEIANNVGTLANLLINIGSGKARMRERVEAAFDSEELPKAVRGDIEAMKVMQRHERYSRKNQDLANEWLEKLVAAGDLESIDRLSLNYSLGKQGYPKNKEEEFRLLNKLYEASFVRYQKDPSDAEAYHYVLSAANNISLKYINGQHQPIDSAQSMAWLKKAAAFGSITSLNRLGYYYGRNKANRDSSDYYFQIAAKLIDKLSAGVPDLYTNYKNYDEPLSITHHDETFLALANNADGLFGSVDKPLALGYYLRAVEIAKAMENTFPSVMKSKSIKEAQKKIKAYQK